MVNQALQASVDALDPDELDELIEYAATKRFGAIFVSEEQRAVIASRRNDTNPENWLTHAEFEARIDARFS